MLPSNLFLVGHPVAKPEPGIFSREYVNRVVHLVLSIRVSDVRLFRLLGQFSVGPKQNERVHNKIFLKEELKF